MSYVRVPLRPHLGSIKKIIDSESSKVAQKQYQMSDNGLPWNDYKVTRSEGNHIE